MKSLVTRVNSLFIIRLRCGSECTLIGAGSLRSILGDDRFVLVANRALNCPLDLYVCKIRKYGFTLEFVSH